MPPISPDKKAATHEKILTEGAKLLREAGIDGTSVEKVMKAAGLTVGGFYAHFDSKDQMIAELLAKAFSESATRPGSAFNDSAFSDSDSGSATGSSGAKAAPGPAKLRQSVKSYLSRSHRDHPQTGCPIPASLSGLATADEGGAPARQVLARGVEGMAARTQMNLTNIEAAERRKRALAIVAMMVGGLTLSRALGPTPLSDEILKACRDLAAPEDS